MKKQSELTYEQESLIEFLNGAGTATKGDIAKMLGISKLRVGSLVRQIRRKFLEGKFSTYIYTTKYGYTTNSSLENVVYESRLRMQIGFGVLLNGVYVFKRCKALSSRTFNQLSIEFQPKAITVNKVIK